MEVLTRPPGTVTTAAGPWLVVGADGAVGRELVRRTTPDGAALVGTSRRPDAAGIRLDLAAPPWHLPDRVAVAFLCAAITSGERCRQFPADTRRINVDRTLELAGELRARGAHLVFLSTNQVFDGTRPRVPTDAPVHPQTEYGRQKAAVEAELLAAGGAAVVRFGKILPPVVPLFRTWAEALRRGEPIEPFSDLVIAPVPMAFAADVLVRVAGKRVTGAVHVSGETDVSYADIAFRLADRLGIAPDLIRPIPAASKGIPPEMAPPHTTLDTARVFRDLGLTIPAVSDTIDALLEQVTHD